MWTSDVRVGTFSIAPHFLSHEFVTDIRRFLRFFFSAVKKLPALACCHLFAKTLDLSALTGLGVPFLGIRNWNPQCPRSFF